MLDKKDKKKKKLIFTNKKIKSMTLFLLYRKFAKFNFIKKEKKTKKKLEATFFLIIKKNTFLLFFFIKYSSNQIYS